MGGYAYYSGVRFSLYAPGWSQALVRGGRYDEVGSVFGRKRPAVGFSLDVKALASRVSEPGPRAAIRAPWSEDADLKAAVRRLREAGETVVFDLPGSPAEECGREFDRVLTPVAGRWVLQSV
jgi:ATP phosphoribosyltransferase regulatory subunit